MHRARRVLLTCGIVAPLLYIVTDMVASHLYPGYSFTDQAVSELFAIGAPTARLVVPSFTLSTALFAAFSFGVWTASGHSRAVHVMALMIMASAIDTVFLWNLFPMHMRGVAPTFTDTMHAVLAINPFVLLTIACGVVAFKGWFRWYSVGTVVLQFVFAPFAFAYVPNLLANQPTPWLGLAERIPQYGHQLWHAILAIVLLHRQTTQDPNPFARLQETNVRF